MESVTERVISAAKNLEVIAFTGSGYSEFIPAHEFATRRGVAICTSQGSNAVDVAEFTIGMIFEMAKKFPLLRTRNQEKGNSFCTTRRLSGQTLGVIGFGSIGVKVAELACALKLKVLVNSRSEQNAQFPGVEFVGLEELLRRSDIVTLHVNKLHGEHVLGTKELSLLRDNAIVINAAFPDAVDIRALVSELEKGRLRAAFDAPAEGENLSSLPLATYNYSNSSTAFNTLESITDTSDRSTSSIINMLEQGDDPDVVNPEFKKFRSFGV